MDDRAFTERTRAIGVKLYRISCTLLSCEADREDAMSEAVLKAWRKKEGLRQAAYFETWLISILINECRNIYRKAARRAAPLPDQLPAPEPRMPALHDALMALPEKYRLIVELHYIEGYEVSEIAQMITLPKGTVSWRLSQARKLLKAELEDAVR